ncbi:hypothetical protein PIB30_004419 [Stylosanthes scabra]|uniref:Uncharacterized protein n=1 Tax=Stylosanthes scabra TaxID=79078 RepID=A0ABU6V5H7_9FABA|nr:hypothetical protein [Stylosanthes scabra]
MTESDLTQGYPQSQLEDEQVANDNEIKPVIKPSRRGDRSNYATRPPLAASNQQQPPQNVVIAPAIRRGGFRAKIQIVRSQSAFLRSNPTMQVHARPTVPQRPNAPFRPPTNRPNASASQGSASGVSNSTRQPRVSIETISGSSKATTTRFQEFMPSQTRNKENNP